MAFGNQLLKNRKTTNVNGPKNAFPTIEPIKALAQNKKNSKEKLLRTDVNNCPSVAFI
jgi:hypothetical protein